MQEDVSLRCICKLFLKSDNTNHYNLKAILAVDNKVDLPRADSEKQHMGLQTWKDVPNRKIQRFEKWKY